MKEAMRDAHREQTFIEVDKAFDVPSGERRDERENTARGSKDEPNRRDETLAKASDEEDWQGMVTLDPAFYLKDYA